MLARINPVKHTQFILVIIICLLLTFGCKPKAGEQVDDSVNKISNKNTESELIQDYNTGWFKPNTQLDQIVIKDLVPEGNTRWHITFFWASWCDECELMLKDIDRFSIDNPDISCELISIDSEEAQQDAVNKLKRSKVKTPNRFAPDIIAKLQVGGAPLMYLSERTPKGNFLRLANVPLSEIARLTDTIKKAGDQPLVFPNINIRIKADNPNKIEVVLLPQNNNGAPLDYMIEIMSRTRDTDKYKAGEKPLLRETSENAGSVFEPKVLDVIELNDLDKYISLTLETLTGANCNVRNGLFWIIDLDALRAGKSDISVTAHTAANKTK